jgi:hypothetical protein
VILNIIGKWDPQDTIVLFKLHIPLSITPCFCASEAFIGSVKSLDPLREAPVPSEGEGLVAAKTNRISLEQCKGTTIF